MKALLIAATTSLLLVGHAHTTVAEEGVMLIRHKVADYSKWRPVYESNEQKRTAAGLTNGRVLQVDGNPNEIVILLDASDLEKARAFSMSEELKAGMMKAGVTGKPEILFLSATP